MGPSYAPGDEYATSAVTIVFVVGLWPQVKMKRADVLLKYHELFSDLIEEGHAVSTAHPEEVELVGSLTESAAGGKTATYDLKGSLRPPTDDSLRDQAVDFFTRFWGQQQSQFSLWRYGLVPSDTFMYWMSRRMKNLNESKTYLGRTSL